MLVTFVFALNVLVRCRPPEFPHLRCEVAYKFSIAHVLTHTGIVYVGVDRVVVVPAATRTAPTFTAILAVVVSVACMYTII